MATTSSSAFLGNDGGLGRPDDPDPEERLALEWLERQDAPGIAASEAVARTAASHFVPVNDAAVVSRALQERRAREVYGLMDQISHDLTDSNGEITVPIGRLRTKLARKRDLGSTVGNVGKTSAHSAIELFPDKRPKQERWFPSVSPLEPRVTYVWNAPPPPRWSPLWTDYWSA